MTKSLSKDIQLLTKIAMNQEKIKNVLKTFNCDSHNIIYNEMAFDLCSFYMSQIGEAANHLTDSTKKSFKYFDSSCTYYFRNKVDHVYEKVNKVYIKTYIFSTISNETVKEIRERIAYCKQNSRK